MWSASLFLFFSESFFYVTLTTVHIDLEIRSKTVLNIFNLRKRAMNHQPKSKDPFYIKIANLGILKGKKKLLKPLKVPQKSNRFFWMDSSDHSYLNRFYFEPVDHAIRTNLCPAPSFDASTRIKDLFSSFPWKFAAPNRGKRSYRKFS